MEYVYTMVKAERSHRNKRFQSSMSIEMAMRWKWRKLCIRREDKECDEHVHDEINFRRKVHACNYKKEKWSVNCYGVIGIFTHGVLRIIDNDKDFISEDAIEEEVKKLTDDVIQDIKNNEATSATDASVKD